MSANFLIYFFFFDMLFHLVYDCRFFQLFILQTFCQPAPIILSLASSSSPASPLQNLIIGFILMRDLHFPHFCWYLPGICVFCVFRLSFSTRTNINEFWENVMSFGLFRQMFVIWPIKAFFQFQCRREPDYIIFLL